MGIIDTSTTYTFFYALPFAILMLYYAPLLLKNYYNLELKKIKFLKLLWIPFALISSLSGPLNPGISLIISFLLFSEYFMRSIKTTGNIPLFYKIKVSIQKIPLDYFFYLVPVSLFSLYSLYLGGYNSVSLTHKLPLSDLYAKIPEGIYYQFTQKLGFPVLFSILAINTIIIRTRYKTAEGEKILRTFKWIGIFALVYIILLPLGGYRNYRPYILRYDTILPLTLALLFMFGKMTSFILNHISNRQKFRYIPIIVFVLVIYTNSDEPGFDKNKCERAAICKIAGSAEAIVKVDNNCTVLSSTLTVNPKDSVLKVKLLEIWGIMSGNKLFYQ
jgi:hypothetical protein